MLKQSEPKTVHVHAELGALEIFHAANEFSVTKGW